MQRQCGNAFLSLSRIWLKVRLSPDLDVLADRLSASAAFEGDDVSDAPATPPAGWFPDPGGTPQDRFWDGTTWSEHLRPPGIVSRPPLPRLASFGQRAGAAIIDGLLLSVPVFAGMGILVAVALGPIFSAAAAGREPSEADIAAFLTILPLFLLLQFAAFALNFLYYMGFEGRSGGQTIGKWFLGIRVMDVATAGDASRRTVGIRTLVKVFASGQVLLGYLWMLWDKEKRTWHDMAATTQVVIDPRPKRSFSELRRSFTLKKDDA